MKTYNFTITELVNSPTAERLHIDNTPSAAIISKLTELIKYVLQPIRDAYKKPIYVSSGYRCPRLNKAVGGVPTSQHVKGEAADIYVKNDNKELFIVIKKLIEDKKIVVGQLIDEYNYKWIHVSLPTDKHKNQILHIK